MSAAVEMKLSVLVVALMAIVAVQVSSVENDTKVAERQRFLLEILLRMDDDLQLEEWIKQGGKLVTDKTFYTEYDEFMVKFYQSYRAGGLMPRGEFFSVMNRLYIIQSRGLFGFFYFAKDWETMERNIIWARLHVNEGMFVYALTMATIHRKDMQGMVLPQIYEIFPQMFLNSKYIVEAEKFNWDTFNRKIMLEKELRAIYEQDPPGEMLGRRFFQMDFKMWQWWKLMGLDDGWHVEEKYPLRAGSQLLDNDTMSAIYSGLNAVWLPVDYTRDIGIFNDDSVMSYFTEDVDWNAYWYYLNVDYPKILPANAYNLDKDRRGEWWIYNVQQLLARYNMERLSHRLGPVDMVNWSGVVPTGYNPQLMAYNGNGFSVRKNYWQIESDQNLDVLNKLVNIERRIRDFVNSGRFVMRDGTVVDLLQPGSVEIIAGLLQGNVDSVDWNFFGPWLHLSNAFLSGAEYHDSSVAPNVLQNYETMLRDPVTYSLFKTIVDIFQQFYNHLPPYKNEELLLPGVDIVGIEVSKLETYFDLVDTDITTLLNDKMVYLDGKLVWDKVLLARQQRLNHKPFYFNLIVEADKPQKVVARAFIAPQFDQYGQQIQLLTHREYFMKLDEFTHDLAEGMNTIHRRSEDFTWTKSSEALSYSGWYNYLMKSNDGEFEFLRNVSSAHSLFPDRLILPRGWTEGMPLVLFVVISPYKADVEQYSTYDPSWQAGIGSGVRHVDNMPFGYPLERKIDTYVEFKVPNMFVMNIEVYHSDKLAKYVPMKYENYGKFDYNY